MTAQNDSYPGNFSSNCIRYMIEDGVTGAQEKVEKNPTYMLVKGW